MLDAIISIKDESQILFYDLDVKFGRVWLLSPMKVWVFLKSSIQLNVNDKDQRMLNKYAKSHFDKKETIWYNFEAFDNDWQFQTNFF